MKRIRARIAGYPITIGVVVFVGVLSVVLFFSVRVYQLELSREQAQVKDETEKVKEQLVSELNHSITATRVLKFLLERDLLQDNFDSISHDLLAENPFIDALQLVEGSVIARTYPLKGNEPTIGFDIKNDHYEAALESIERKAMYFEGPIELVQGGVGLVGRNPVFRQGKFWGFAVAVVRQSTLLEAIGLDQTSGQFEYQLAKQLEDGTWMIFYGNEQAFVDGVFSSEFLPVCNWMVTVRMKKPQAWNKMLPVVGLGFLLALTLGFLGAYMARQPATLHHMVRESTEQLQTRSDQLAKTNEELERFAYAISHDLQEPLRMISSFLTLLQKKYAPKLDDKANQYIHMAVDGASRMRQIILDILDLSRVGRIQGEEQEENMAMVVEQVAKMYEIQLKAMNGKITIGELPTLVMVRAEALQIFQNLMSNAIKYADKERPLDIQVSARKVDSFWEFSLADNGIGIEPEHFDRIFQIFQRLHTRQEYSGTGVGLSIVKKIVESKGGRVWVESVPSQGSTFLFTLPV